MNRVILHVSVGVAVIVMAREARAVDFTQDIEPILQAHCIDCHGPE